MASLQTLSEMSQATVEKETVFESCKQKKRKRRRREEKKRQTLSNVMDERDTGQELFDSKETDDGCKVVLCEVQEKLCVINVVIITPSISTVEEEEKRERETQTRAEIADVCDGCKSNKDSHFAGLLSQRDVRNQRMKE